MNDQQRISWLRLKLGEIEREESKLAEQRFRLRQELASLLAEEIRNDKPLIPDAPKTDS